MSRSTEHTTSSGVKITSYPSGGVIIQPQHGFSEIALSDTEYRELIMYGYAEMTNRSYDGR